MRAVTIVIVRESDRLPEGPFTFDIDSVGTDNIWRKAIESAMVDEDRTAVLEDPDGISQGEMDDMVGIQLPALVVAAVTIFTD